MGVCACLYGRPSNAGPIGGSTRHLTGVGAGASRGLREGSGYICLTYGAIANFFLSRFCHMINNIWLTYGGWHVVGEANIWCVRLTYGGYTWGRSGGRAGGPPGAGASGGGASSGRLSWLTTLREPGPSGFQARLPLLALLPCRMPGSSGVT